MSIPTWIRRKVNLTAAVLLGVAGFQMFLGTIGSFAGIGYSGGADLIGWFSSFSGAIYIALGIAARWVRLPAALIGAVLYGAFLALVAARDMASLKAGLIVEVPIMVLLVAAVL